MLGESLIGTNPGLGFRPMAHDVDQGSLIWYDVSNQTQINYWSNLLDEFMDGETYFNFNTCNQNSLIENSFHLPEYSLGSSNQKNCDFVELPNEGQVCKLDISKFDQCTKEHSFGYRNAAPCIFLKLNRIYGWEPRYFNDPDNLPDDMPNDLRDHITELQPSERNQIWVTCRGESPADRELLGEIEYYPSRGFQSFFYPYLNTKGYLSPLVAVKFLRPASKFSWR